MKRRQQTRFKRPDGPCVYCAWDADVWDHILPVTWTGVHAHAKGEQVPACGDCNARLGDMHSTDIDERRSCIAESLERKHRRLLRSPEWSLAELDELSGTMRITIENKQLLRKIVQFRLDNLNRTEADASETWEMYAEDLIPETAPEPPEPVGGSSPHQTQTRKPLNERYVAAQIGNERAS